MKAKLVRLLDPLLALMCSVSLWGQDCSASFRAVFNRRNPIGQSLRTRNPGSQSKLEANTRS